MPANTVTLPAAALAHLSDNAKSHLPSNVQQTHVVDITAGGTFNATSGTDYFVIDAKELLSLSNNTSAPSTFVINGFDIYHDFLVTSNFDPIGLEPRGYFDSSGFYTEFYSQDGHNVDVFGQDAGGTSHEMSGTIVGVDTVQMAAPPGGTPLFQTTNWIHTAGDFSLLA